MSIESHPVSIFSSYLVSSQNEVVSLWEQSIGNLTANTNRLKSQELPANPILVLAEYLKDFNEDRVDNSGLEYGRHRLASGLNIIDQVSELAALQSIITCYLLSEFEKAGENINYLSSLLIRQATFDFFTRFIRASLNNSAIFVIDL